jgi:ribonucleoside-diphosphate reductase alpha chain
MAYSYDEALEASLEYFGGDNMRATTFLQKYALKSLDGDEYYEKDPDDLHDRLADEFYRIEQQFENPLSREKIRKELDGFGHIIPNGSPMAAIGNDIQLMSASNCFVAGNTSDSYGGILSMDEDLAQIMKRRGGVGVDISHLRPKGENVSNAARSSTGAVSFMDRLSETTREVAQGGRRGALMITMHIRHPEAEGFIDIKADETSVTGANVSLKVTDDFMRAVYEGENFIQRYPVDASPEEAQVTKEVNAEKLWHKLIDTARDHAEPGVLFWDKMTTDTPADCYSDLGYKTHSTNPCGEVPLEIGGACRLTAMNLFSFVRNPFTDRAYFDYDKFRESVRIGQRIMDDIVQLDIEKIDEIIDKVKADEEPKHVKHHELKLWQNIREHARESRRTGLGLTALGDTLAGLGVRYGSAESREITDEILRTQKVEAYRESVNLAKERGAFDIYDHSRERGNEFIERLREDDPELVEEMEKYGRRNIAVLSIAPTGTVSQMAETTSGIENLFQPFYQRRRKVNPDDEEVEVDFVDDVGDAWQEFIVFHPRFEQYLDIQGYDVDTGDPDMERLEEIRKESPYDGATVSDVDWVSKVKLQGVIQKHIDHSISVTTNLPEDIGVERVKDVYEESWRAGCKGCTIYRQGSRSGVLTDAGGDEDEDGIVYNDAPERPEELDCDIHQVRYSGEPWKILVGRLDGDPYEIFAIKTGGDTGIRIRFTDSEDNAVEEGVIVKQESGVYDLEAPDGKTIVEDIADHAPDDQARVATRLLSLALRHGVEPKYIVNQLESANGSVVSFGRAVLKAMRRYLDVEPDDACPECGEDQLVYQEGCVTCRACGYSKCG